MISLPQETEALAQRLAMAQQLPVEEAIRLALEERARTTGFGSSPLRRRMSIESMLAVGDEIAALPLLDKRSPREIMDDISSS